jgi:hypothetical protein
MAYVNNPAKVFNFRIDFPGRPWNQWLAQKVTIPEHEIEVVEHGDANHVIKTGGLIKFGMITVEKISEATQPDSFAWGWIRQVQSVIRRGGDLPIQYKATCLITQLSVDGITPLNVWECTGVWPSKINGIDLSRTESENTMQTIEFCVDGIEVRNGAGAVIASSAASSAASAAGVGNSFIGGAAAGAGSVI